MTVSENSRCCNRPRSTSTGEPVSAGEAEERAGCGCRGSAAKVQAPGVRSEPAPEHGETSEPKWGCC